LWQDFQNVYLGNSVMPDGFDGNWPPGEAPAYAGTDFIIAQDGRIAAVICFSASYPDLDSTVRRTMPNLNL